MHHHGVETMSQLLPRDTSQSMVTATEVGHVSMHLWDGHYSEGRSTYPFSKRQ